jgi:hypothetical protein
MLSATVYFSALMRDYPGSLAITAAEPMVSRETNYFLGNIGKVKTPSDLIHNSRLYTYVMKAFGLSDMAFAKALISKVLEGGISNPKSLANTLNDPRYRVLAAAFDFASNGQQTTSSSTLQELTVNNYVEQTLETNAGKQNQGTQLALYFQRMAPNITSAYSILADKNLLKVVQTAFNLPASMSLQNLDVQAKMITAHLKITDLKNPVKLKAFLDRFTAAYDANDATSTSAFPRSALLVGSPGISTDLLLSLASLKSGGP